MTHLHSREKAGISLDLFSFLTMSFKISVNKNCNGLFLLLYVVGTERWQISGGWGWEMHSPGCGGKLCQRIANFFQEAVCGQTGGKLVLLTQGSCWQTLAFIWSNKLKKKIRIWQFPLSWNVYSCDLTNTLACFLIFFGLHFLLLHDAVVLGKHSDGCSCRWIHVSLWKGNMLPVIVWLLDAFLQAMHIKAKIKRKKTNDEKTKSWPV